MILDGKKIAKKRKQELKKSLDRLHEEGKRNVHLAVIMVGNDPASRVYVNSKKRQAEEIGMKSSIHLFEDDIEEKELIYYIDSLNRDESVDGILLQLPLPSHLNEEDVLSKIDPKKDVDGLHMENIALLKVGKPRFIPCTPLGIVNLLHEYDFKFEGKDALIIGRSRLVGAPLADILLQKNMTVTIAHSKTKNLEKKIKDTDLLVVAIGQKEYIKSRNLSPNTIVIDVGIHRDGKKIYGDVEGKAINQVKAMTPVPGGVGPMTIATLLENTYQAYLLKEGEHDEL